MVSSGEAGKVNISGTTYELVKDKFIFTHCGRIRGWIYRNTATYKSIGLREKFVITNSALLKLVEENVSSQNLGDIASIIESSGKRCKQILN